MMWTGLAVSLSYVLGSVPTGFWLGLWLRRVDIREQGSKNIGATNTLRVLGKKLGALALLGDVCKGAASVLLVAQLSPWPYAPLVCGLAAILGHTFSVFLRFKGGKGVATSAGMFLALCPLPTLIGVVVFFTVVAVTRMVSAGSITAAIAMAVAVFAMPIEWVTYPTQPFPEPTTLRAVALIIALLILIRHRTNIVRILQGTENRF